MKTMKELISYYSKQLAKVMQSHGTTSEHTAFAFYQLQGINMGMTVGESAAFASSEVERLHKITLANV